MYQLTRDIGDSANPVTNMYPSAFTGIFFGNNHTIYVNIRSTLGYTGVFSELLDANIFDLIIDGSIINTFPMGLVGGVAGYAHASKITNCINYANITGEGMRSFVGGIVG